MAPRKRADSMTSNSKAHKKRAGFDAFAIIQTASGKKGRTISYEKPELPETGIHSLAWAAAIVPQKQIGFLSLPYEVRLKIYRHAIGDFTRKGKSIEPVKDGKKFKSQNWPDAARDTAVLSETCRQMYVDCIGGGLLYKLRSFQFHSLQAMMNYLWVINPFHKEVVQSISLDISIGANYWSLPKKPFLLLAECKGLEKLTLSFIFETYKCGPGLPRAYPHDSRGNYNWRRVPWNDLDKIERNEALREVIKNLKELHMSFWSEEFEDRALWSSFHSLEAADEDKRADCPYRNVTATLEALLPKKQ